MSLSGMSWLHSLRVLPTDYQQTYQQLCITLLAADELAQ